MVGTQEIKSTIIGCTFYYLVSDSYNSTAEWVSLCPFTDEKGDKVTMEVTLSIKMVEPRLGLNSVITTQHIFFSRVHQVRKYLAKH